VPTVIGVGIDVVGIERFEAVLARTPSFPERVFAPVERLRADGTPLTASSLAARFAAKEAVAKVLVRTGGLSWTDVRVLTGSAGEPSLELDGAALEAASRLGITRWHVSMSHDGGVAAALVVAQGA
jgi:holo-[acyl-carrier protein] synthase